MKPAPFQHHRPTSVAEAVELLAQLGDEAKVLAGGQSLIPVMALRLGRPAHLVDISLVEGLDGIDVASGRVSIGATVTHATAERSPELAQHAPLVHQAIPHVGHRAIRTRGTVCGSIAHADPAAELPAVCLAGDALMHLTSTRGSRNVEAADFFEGYLETALEPDELLTAVSFPASVDGTGTAVVEESRRHGDYALVGLACQVTVSGATISEAALAFFGASSTAVRVAAAERSLVGSPPGPESFATAASIVRSELEPTADIHGSANYRRHLAAILTERGLAAATAAAGTGAAA